MSAREKEKTFQLDEPVQLGGESFSEITLKRPNAGEIESLQRGIFKENVTAPAVTFFIATQLKKPPTDVRKIDGDAFNEMQEWVLSFLNSPQKSSEPS